MGIHLNKRCLQCHKTFEAETALDYFCSDSCKRIYSFNDRIFRNDLERIKYNKEHGTLYSYGEYMYLKRSKRLNTNTYEKSDKNINTKYWINVPKKVTID